ncbi:MAG: M48 family metallopeptidase [Chloroflexi bacterium]|nr:M48 family metallopeptidase [Chloroflexota bacterium]
MNLFFAVILGAVLTDWALGVVADMLNLRSLKNEPPRALQGLYDTTGYRNSQEYLRQTTYFGFVSGTFQLLLTLAFWFLGGFNVLDQLIRSWGLHTIVTGLLYIGLLGAGYMVVMLPFSAYAVFSIEQRFGFNRMTPAVFVADRLKGLGLSVLIGAPLLAGVQAVFLYGGTLAWLYCWAGVAAVSLFIQFIAPTWIMPMFNKFEPLGTGDLREAIMGYADKVGYRVEDVFIMDGSKRSTKSNAFFTGFGRSRRIVLFDTLVAAHTVPELVAVLAHEIGHYKKKHVLQGAVLGVLHTGILFFLLAFFMKSPGLYEAFGLQQQSVYAGLLFFGLLYTPVELLLSMGLQALSRRNEYEADRFATMTVEDPKNLEEALKKLSVKNLSNLSPHPFYVLLNYSHPPLLQRIEAIQRASGRTGGA